MSGGEGVTPNSSQDELATVARQREGSSGCAGPCLVKAVVHSLQDGLISRGPMTWKEGARDALRRDAALACIVEHLPRGK